MTFRLRSLVVLALAVHATAAWFSLGHYHADEHSSILAFAAHKFGAVGRQDLAWEYEAEIRSGFQPFIAYALGKALLAGGVYSPFLLAFLLRLFSAALALGAILVVFNACRRSLSESAGAFFLVALLFLWPMVFYHVRFSSEGWATSFFLIGLGCWKSAGGDKRLLFAAGVAWGFAFLSRYQIGFMLLGVGAWMLVYNRESIARVATGGAAVIALGCAMDWQLYGNPTIAWVNYFAHHAASNSTSLPRPWHAYITRGAALFPPLSLFALPIVVAFCWIFRRGEIAWAVIPYLLFHMLIDNKQTRFLYPLAPLFLLMTATLWDKYRALVADRGWRRDFAALTIKATFALNVPMLAYPMFFPAAPEISLIRDCVLPMAGASPSVLVMRKNDDMAKPFYIGDLPTFVVNDERELGELTRRHRDKTILYATRKNRKAALEDSGLDHALACQLLPDWAEKINFNDWASRASIWRVWKISP